MIQNNILVNNNNSNNSLRFFTSLCETNSILQPSWGTGPATFSRASAQYITDFEGVVRKVESGSVAVEGSRVVTNLLTYSEDLSNAAWVKESTCTVTGANTVNLPNVGDTITNSFTSPLPIGSTIRGRVKVSGSGTITLIVKRLFGGGVLEQSTVVITLSTTPTDYSVSRTITNTGQIGGNLTLTRNTGDTATSVTVHNAQIENVTGQSNTNPGEYVKTTSAAVSKCFATTNGNTVDANGVVTEATGTALPQSYSERQNSTAYALNDKIQVGGWWYNCTTAGTSASSAPTFPTGKAGSQTVTDGTAVWTIGGRLLLGYVSEPASSNKVTAYGIIPADTLGSELSSGSLTIGQKYQITARTDANFVADGAADNVVGTQFVATAATVTLDAGDKVQRVQWGVGEKSFHNGSAFVQNITGLTLSGDVAAVLSIVTDEAEITKAGLAGINPGYKVYKLDNSGGSAAAYVTINGGVANTNPHSLLAFGRATLGTTYLYITTTSGAPTFSSGYKRIVWENRTPGSIGTTMGIYSLANSVVYFLLPQLEELPYSTSIMPTAGATATRAETSLSYPTAGNLSGNDVTVGVEAYFVGLNSTSNSIFHTRSATNNYLSLYTNTTSINFNKRITTSYLASTSAPATINAQYKVLGKVSKMSGISIFSNGAKGSTTNSNTVDAPLGNAFYLGQDGNSALDFQPMNGYLRNLKIWFKPLSDDRCKQLTL